MEIIQICPKCGVPAIEVNETAVKYYLNELVRDKIEANLKWSACINPTCVTSYFSKKNTFIISDLIKPLFYKNSSDNVPICYCSDLTRGEIINAVKNGCKTIDDVQAFTQKNITGYCEERNPLGKCCRKVFLKTIADAGSGYQFVVDRGCCEKK